MDSWEKLPCGLVEQVLALLPVPNLCRYRSVCKRWNSLICSPNFSAQCIQNVSAGIIKGEYFCVKLRFCPRNGARNGETWGWSIFDLDTRRWFQVEHTLPKGFDFNLSTVDAGLICTFRNVLTDEQRRASTIHNPFNMELQMLVVSNLIGKSMRVLPNPPLRIYHADIILHKLVVDKVSQAFKIFLMSAETVPGKFPQDPCMCVYDSSTDQWRPSTNPPANLIRDPDMKVCSAVYEGVLYVLIANEARLIRGLCRYNDLAGSWEDTRVKFGQDFMLMTVNCALVVSNNRLFLTYQCLGTQNSSPWVRRWQPMWSYQTFWPLCISEVSLSEKRCKMVVQMTEAEAVQRFDIQKPLDRPVFCTYAGIRVVGLDNSIVLMLKKVQIEGGNYILYNLVTGLWNVLPPNPVERLDFEGGNHGSFWRDGKYATAYLRLPNTPWD